jgi:hypothetical protein
MIYYIVNRKRIKIEEFLTAPSSKRSKRLVVVVKQKHF